MRIIEPDLLQGKAALLILLASAILRSLCGPVSVTANMTGNQSNALKITLLTLIMGGLLICVLTVNFGLAGTATGMSFLTVTRALLLRRMLKQELVK